MFKKENIIDELIESMQKNFAYISSFKERNKNDRLKKAHNYVLSASNIFNKFAINQESINDYNSAIDLLNSAIEIYDDYGLKSKSDEILFLLEKIGNSEKIIENYKSSYFYIIKSSYHYIIYINIISYRFAIIIIL